MNANPILPGRPEPGEYPSYTQPYLDCIHSDDILHALPTQMQQTQALLRNVEDRRATEFTYAPGKWNLKQVVGHLIDMDRIFSYRAVCLARNETQTLPSFDQNAYVEGANFTSRPFRNLLEELQLVRQSTIALVQGMTQQAWLQRGAISTYTASPRGVIFVLAGHEMYHHKILREKYLTA